MQNAPTILTAWLQIAAAAQLVLALLNLALPKMLRWEDELNRLPLRIREVFYVHAWFISVTLAIFGVMTLRFVHDIAAGTNPACQWLSGTIGFFWSIRTVLQLTYYSSSHWRGLFYRMVIHITLVAIYGGFAVLYLWSAFRWTGGGL